MKPIFLIGYMGCGKSTLGRNVARMTGLQFIDLDNFIEARFHASVKEIFASRGEEGFRDIERRMLIETSDFQDVIVACGGGTPCFFDNMEIMNSKGVTVYLDASLEKLHTRLMRGRHKRPLIAGMESEQLREFIVKALESRMPYYSKARMVFRSDLLENEAEVGETASRFISQLGLTAKESDI
ncbi:shikimate kinase [Paramuribaculum intestinale]|jgi:Shikimate kinase|uniref:shikimate kinase n=1 Tax=Paramuribaculum intestinale TaxID=2094151 RepID=UPI000F46485F|nr:shikimate kinase [Paramuribaculum intestinale]ROT17188.1 shikimate kinase [Muribaculaceae bacterium Isolate-105 (HZI)]RXE62845.1 shikimate kinase [Muribaculaceae bacterium Isolate-004 (NCI)]